MSDNDRTFCKVASGEEESEIVHGEEGVVAFHSIGDESAAHVRFYPEDYVASPDEIGVIPEGRVRNTDLAEFGYPIRTNNSSDAGQEIFLHPHAHVMGGGKLERL